MHSLYVIMCCGRLTGKCITKQWCKVFCNSQRKILNHLLRTSWLLIVEWLFWENRLILVIQLSCFLIIIVFEWCTEFRNFLCAASKFCWNLKILSSKYLKRAERFLPCNNVTFEINILIHLDHSYIWEMPACSEFSVLSSKLNVISSWCIIMWVGYRVKVPKSTCT